mmetsp:Transcript_36623/g.105528  ORF Transcript_36623/g.105528 Transcript_36623/m.105528 type:complete len:391 (-) Transcript_36623:234-1406(-)
MQDKEFTVCLTAHRRLPHSAWEEERQLTEPVASLQPPDLHPPPQHGGLPAHDEEHLVSHLLLRHDGVTHAGPLRTADLAEPREDVLLAGLEERKLFQDAAGDCQSQLVLQGVREDAHDLGVQGGDRVRLVDVLDVPEHPELELLLHAALLHEEQRVALGLHDLSLDGPQRGDHLGDARQELPDVAHRQHQDEDRDCLLECVVGMDIAVAHRCSRRDGEVEGRYVLRPAAGAAGGVQALRLQPRPRGPGLGVLAEHSDGIPTASNVVGDHQHHDRHLQELERNSHALGSNHLLLHHLNEPAQLQDPEHLHHARNLGVAEDLQHAHGLSALGVQGLQADDLDDLQPGHRGTDVDPEPALGVVLGDAPEVVHQPAGDPVALVVSSEEIQDNVR